MEAVSQEPGNDSFPKLNTESDTTLEKPDLQQLRNDRLERNREVMKVKMSRLINKSKSTYKKIDLLQVYLYYIYEMDNLCN